MEARILVVDDDPHLREVVRFALEHAGFQVEQARDGAEAVERVRRRAPDLVVLDVMLPGLDGYEVCRAIRRFSDVPVLFLSSRGEELDRVLGLELGGDDYLAKPFSPRELVSRVRAILRRTRRLPGSAATAPTLVAGPLKLDVEAHRAWVGDAELNLTVTEFRILEVLMRRPGRAYARSELIERAYPGRHHVSERTLDSHIRRIRAKCREHGIDPVETVHGLGYRLADAI